MIKKVTFKIDEFELSELDDCVERAKTTRSEYVRQSVNEQMKFERPGTLNKINVDIMKILKRVEELAVDRAELNKFKEDSNKLKQSLQQSRDENSIKIKQLNATNEALSTSRQHYNDLKQNYDKLKQDYDKLMHFISQGVLELNDFTITNTVLLTKKEIANEANKKIRERIKSKLEEDLGTTPTATQNKNQKGAQLCQKD